MSNEAFTVKQILDLQRGIGILNSRDMLTKLQAMDLSPEVRELVNLGFASVNATYALEKRIADHQAAYDATLPLQPFQTYEAGYWPPEGDQGPDVPYGIFDARTENEAVKLAHEAGATKVTNARSLTQSEMINHVAKAKGMEVIEQPLVKPTLSNYAGFPTRQNDDHDDGALERSTKAYNEEIEMRTRMFGAPD